ncbi:hypothetical protein [Ferruginibacter albus]|uniref:hypothetical protein n=1 Tax=Ferruginibacter albus TaxID=2875540 RepID=UPI001CC37376|nr:hypothetical protein [Ferruginibacter albus]UAY53016.1 hypothetical protein K9M53_04885 [Ferruginibacter albus]
MKKVLVTLLGISSSAAVFAGTSTESSTDNGPIAVIGFFVVLVAAIVIPAIKGGKRHKAA